MAATVIPKRKRGPLLILVALMILVGSAWGLAKAGVLPVATWTAKNKAAQRAAAALGLGPKAAAKRAAPDKKAAAAPADPSAPLEEPAATAPAPAPEVVPALGAKPRRGDNTARVAKILTRMEPAQVAGLFSQMPDAEVAPLLLKMKDGTAGEVLAALPAARAARLTRYLRRYPG